jgi:hypothetical protein
MRIVDLTSGATKLRLAMETLQAVWRDTADVWRDAAALEFQENYLAALEPRVKAALEAVNRLSLTLARGQRECEDT